MALSTREALGGVVPYEHTFPGVGWVRVGGRPAAASTEAPKPKPLVGPEYFEFGPAEGDTHIDAVECLLGGTGTGGAAFIETKGGGGTWEVVKRPYLPPLTVWRGPSEPYIHKIPLLLDAYMTFTNQASEQSAIAILGKQYAAIEAMAGMYMGKPSHRPPILWLNGNIHHAKDFQWVISESPEWGESIRNTEGKLVRQALTLTFMRYESNIEQSRKAESNRPSVRQTHTYPVGSSFEEIAEHKWPKRHFGKLLLEHNRNHGVKLYPPKMNHSTKFTKPVSVIFPTTDEVKTWEHIRRG